MPSAEELIGSSKEGPAPRQDGHRAGFEDIVWFRMDIGRRQNADPRWLLPLICRRGHVTKNEIGAIRIAANETMFQIPRSIAGKFTASVARTASADGGDEAGLKIEAVQGEPRQAEHRPRLTPSARPGGPVTPRNKPP